MENCDTCFKIICQKCQWEPTEEQVVLIQKKTLTACPVCGWIPGNL